MAEQKNSQSEFMPTAVGRKAKEAGNKAPDGTPAGTAPSGDSAKGIPAPETPMPDEAAPAEKKNSKHKLFGKKKDDADSIKGSINKSLGLSADGVKEVQERLNRLTNATTVAAAVAAVAVLFAGWTGWSSYSEAQKLKSTMHSVVIAAEQIPAGTTITSDMLAMKDVPELYLSQSATSNMEQFLGERANVTIPANDQVSVDMVSGASNTTSAAAQLAEGEQAVTIKVGKGTSGSQGVGGLIRQGDTVDILGIQKDESTTTLIKGARVMALDANLRDATSTYSTVTVALKKNEIKTLRDWESSKNCAVTLALNPKDSGDEKAEE